MERAMNCLVWALIQTLQQFSPIKMNWMLVKRTLYSMHGWIFLPTRQSTWLNTTSLILLTHFKRIDIVVPWEMWEVSLKE